ncbi:copper amine oxidase N-terminal domain-containing protein [Paenibacillus sp. BC26]|uniref:copper amine oxidase N-terminal domain-containing protein n=1 Tax=Paenibacillus sp. BC26 TaxID=1881032 RepID=UPI0008E277A5|nr:copper amine oxidase N-terminal domain-containing protein [Paenibacillus sp. BC26]SFS66241.1 Copper amine oxidase N-terminal domain-containing protein [Paenibacillus sp. BC26]
MQKNDGTLWGWGTNTDAELGAGQNMPVAKMPVPVGIPISLEVNGEALLLTSGVIIRNNQTFIPLRSLLVMLNATISYETKNKVVIVDGKEGSTPPIRISINLKDGEILLNEKSIIPRSKAFVISGTSYIPLRFISEQLGAEVSWNSKENKISIFY